MLGASIALLFVRPQTLFLRSMPLLAVPPSLRARLNPPFPPNPHPFHHFLENRFAHLPCLLSIIRLRIYNYHDVCGLLLAAVEPMVPAIAREIQL